MPYISYLMLFATSNFFAANIDKAENLDKLVCSKMSALYAVSILSAAPDCTLKFRIAALGKAVVVVILFYWALQSALRHRLLRLASSFRICAWAAMAGEAP